MALSETRMADILQCRDIEELRALCIAQRSQLMAFRTGVSERDLQVSPQIAKEDMLDYATDDNMENGDPFWRDEEAEWQFAQDNACDYMLNDRNEWEWEAIPA